MKTFFPVLNALLMFGLLATLSSCDSEQPVAVSAPQVIESAVITEVEVPGVSGASVFINNQKHEINIGIPTIGGPVRITPTYRLISPCVGCSVTASGPIELINDQPEVRTSVSVAVPGVGQLVNYAVKISPMGELGPLTIGALPAALTAESGMSTYLLLPIENNFDGSQTQIRFTNSVTGQQVTTYQTYPFYAQLDPKTLAPNQITVWISTSLLPGTYLIDVVKKNGRQVRVGQTLTLSKGLPVVYSSPYSYSPLIVGAPALNVTGTNLFADDNLELLVTTRSGRQYRLATQNHTAAGASMQVVLPADLEPGDYIGQLIRNRQSVASYTRLTVLKDQFQPAFVSLLQDDSRTKRPAYYSERKSTVVYVCAAVC